MVSIDAKLKSGRGRVASSPLSYVSPKTLPDVASARRGALREEGKENAEEEEED